MLRKTIFLLILLFSSPFVFSQDCDCIANYEWVKKTFEENDAGYQYVIDQKGLQAYADHNNRMLEKIKKAKGLTDCTQLLFEWLQFFRSQHIGIVLNEQVQMENINNLSADQFSNWETYHIKTEDFKAYLSKKKQADPEGIWKSEPYTIGIKKVGDQFLGFIIESGTPLWTKGQIKLKFTLDDKKKTSVFYMRDHTAVESDQVKLLGKNLLKVGNFIMQRIDTNIPDEPKYQQFYTGINANKPYFEQLNQTTLYFRVPSFAFDQKKTVDSVLSANREKILSTPNLIIDIRNNGGGSDNVFSGIIPYLYTNPIRTVGVEFYSTKLNNQRMLDFINDPKYGFNDEDKKWAKESYDILEKKLGQFVNLNESSVSIKKLDSVYLFPKNVGIIINQANGSTAEQFLLAVKQSKKVKLFGVTTMGILDISNMYYVDAPCKKFQLGYSLTRSMRIPDFTIDEKGIQPDYYLDKTIEDYDWVGFVNSVLNE